jgi:hypothetical protein
MKAFNRFTSGSRFLYFVGRTKKYPPYPIKVKRNISALHCSAVNGLSIFAPRLSARQSQVHEDDSVEKPASAFQFMIWRTKVAEFNQSEIEIEGLHDARY